MKNNQFVEKLNTLASVLNQSSLVNSFDVGKEKETYNLAVSLLDIKEAIENVNNQINLLQIDMTEDAINDILWDIGEEFRHILYHILHSKFYNYLDVYDKNEEVVYQI
ncbi:hypothetical protein FACS189429_1790 [Bacteroidia bacterium]|nr:hypothetical protein FACS189429_1790 [Bacteroidia bacterium]GHV44122.1 hypothetical protein FACS1894180_5070 [Bacteroidia bacterium]